MMAVMEVVPDTSSLAHPTLVAMIPSITLPYDGPLSLK